MKQGESVKKGLFLLVLGVLLHMPVSARCEMQSFAYPNRQPYNYTDNGKPSGLLVELADKILKDAGLEFQFSEMPSNRILLEMQQPESQICTFGWFKTPERETFAVFSAPFYQDTPLIALILKKNAGLFEGKHRLQDLIADQTLTMGLIRGWSYGSYVDDLLKTQNVRVMDIPARPQQMYMLLTGRFLYTLLRESEIDEAIALADKDQKDFVAIPLSDLSNDRGKRYFLCGKGVRPEVIDKINASIPKFCKLNP